MDLAFDLEGISTKSCSLARLALEDALWDAVPMKKRGSNGPCYRHFLVHGHSTDTFQRSMLTIILHYRSYCTYKYIYVHL